jgi:periplasmic protein TonB
MSHDMFGDVVHPSVRVGSRKWYTVPVSILTHTIALGALIVAPLVATGELPMPQTFIDVFLPPEPPLPPDVPVVNATPPPAPEIDLNVNAAPIDAPEGLKPEPPPRLAPIVGGLVPTAPSLGNMTTILAPQAVRKAPVRVGGDIRRPERIKYVDPVYPPIAKAARVSGSVIIEATIGMDGSIRNARVIRSVAMLDQAALEAVNQWRYSPTLLNSQPVEVIMSVNVTFAIN